MRWLFDFVFGRARQIMRKEKPQKITVRPGVVADLCVFCFPSTGILDPDGICQMCGMAEPDPETKVLEGVTVTSVDGPQNYGSIDRAKVEVFFVDPPGTEVH